MRVYASSMPLTPSINARIVEGLYAEALALADEVRDCFERLRHSAVGEPDELLRVQFSCEALRTTTRVMHCLAWLLNHRAFLSGELSELQLRRHGRLIANFPASEDEVVRLLPTEAAALVRGSERLYDRIQRLEQAWRGEARSGPSAIEALRQRLSAAMREAG